MPNLKEILDKKDLIEEYCQEFDFSNPRLLFMIGEDSFNILVDNNNSEAYNDVLLETLLENKLDCSCSVTISDELEDYLKKEKQNLTATLDETSKIESLYGKKLHEITISDRQKDPITLARDEDIKKQIIAVFEKKGLASPYELVETKQSTFTTTTKKHKAGKSDENIKVEKPISGKSYPSEEKESPNTQLFKKKQRIDSSDTPTSVTSRPGVKGS